MPWAPYMSRAVAFDPQHGKVRVVDGRRRTREHVNVDQRMAEPKIIEAAELQRLEDPHDVAETHIRRHSPGTQHGRQTRPYRNPEGRLDLVRNEVDLTIRAHHRRAG